MLLSTKVLYFIFGTLYATFVLSLKNDNTNRDKRFISALYYSEWSIKKQLPSNIPLSRVTHIYYAFAGIDVENANIYFNNVNCDLDEKIPFLKDIVENDFKDLKYLNVSANVNSAFYESIPWLNMYLNNIEQTKIKYSEGIIDQLRQMREINPRLKISLAIGGANTSQLFKSITHSKKRLQQFIANVAANVESFGFDGVDFDWEYPSSLNDGNALHYVVENLRILFNKRHKDNHKLITIAIPLDREVLKYYNLAQLEKNVDYFNLMGYDISGKWSQVSSFHSQLYTDTNIRVNAISVDNAIEYITVHVDSSKIVLGMPTYGVSFNTDALYENFNGCAKITFDFRDEDAVEDYKEECIIDYIKLPPKGYVEVDNTELGASYAYKKDGNKGLIVYDTPKIARLKARYVLDRGLAGGMWWDSKGDPLISNPSRSLVYNFIDEIGGIHMLVSNLSNIDSYGPTKNTIVTADVSDTTFTINSSRRKTTNKLLYLYLIVFHLFIWFL